MNLRRFGRHSTLPLTQQSNKTTWDSSFSLNKKKKKSFSPYFFLGKSSSSCHFRLSYMDIYTFIFKLCAAHQKISLYMDCWLSKQKCVRILWHANCRLFVPSIRLTIRERYTQTTQVGLILGYPKQICRYIRDHKRIRGRFLSPVGF